MTETETIYVSKCIFCPLGEEDKRGIVEITRRDQNPTSGEDMITRKYGCGLGDIGAGCPAPYVHSLKLTGKESFILKIDNVHKP